jgi:hypothetical protein
MQVTRNLGPEYPIFDQLIRRLDNPRLAVPQLDLSTGRSSLFKSVTSPDTRQPSYYIINRIERLPRSFHLTCASLEAWAGGITAK